MDVPPLGRLSLGLVAPGGPVSLRLWVSRAGLKSGCWGRVRAVEVQPPGSTLDKLATEMRGCRGVYLAGCGFSGGERRLKVRVSLVLLFYVFVNQNTFVVEVLDSRLVTTYSISPKMVW